MRLIIRAIRHRTGVPPILFAAARCKPKCKCLQSSSVVIALWPNITSNLWPDLRSMAAKIPLTQSEALIYRFPEKKAGKFALDLAGHPLLSDSQCDGSAVFGWTNDPREQRARSENKRVAVTLILSILFHAAILALKLASPHGQLPQQGQRADSRMEVTLASPKQTAAQPLQQKRLLTASPRAAPSRFRVLREAPREWTATERDSMNDFLNDLVEQARPPSGKALAQRALSMARSMHSEAPSLENDESREIMQRLVDANVDPFSIELYFDALFKKMNRSAAMIGNEQRGKGIHPAAVRILLKPDGTVRSFEILREADQKAEIAFVKAVVGLSAPFSAFPPDIHHATNALALLICIRPGESGGVAGAAFSRMGDGQACR